ncbi:MAG: hypothetical protein R2684_02015 [Pyrinomonadaceae bacterium]
MKKLANVSLMLLFASVSILGQEKMLVLEEGIKSHKGIDSIYSDFTKSYQTLDSTLASGLYTENAIYAAPGRDFVRGRPEIKQVFESFFKQVKDSGRTMDIRFRVLKRNVEKRSGFDVGIYEIRQFEGGSEVGRSQGKFGVALKRDRDGKWRFDVDIYNDVPALK